MSVDAYILLADGSNTNPSSGSLNALGLGWRVVGPSPLPAFSVVAFLSFNDGPPDGTASVRLELHDDEDRLVLQGEDHKPVELDMVLEPPDPSLRPVKLVPRVTFQVYFGTGLILEPGYYDWVLSLSEPYLQTWRAKMYVQPSTEFSH